MYRLTFAERLGDEIKAYARRTTRCEEQLRILALTLGGEKGARVADKLGSKVSADTLLNLTRTTPLPTPPTPRMLGVDDFALHKGAKYATVLMDLERNRVIDLLPDREKQTLATWLVDHPGIEIISRDRGSAYAHAGRIAAPNAIQVADRFHLYKNLSETVERILRRLYPQIQQILGKATIITSPAENDLPLKRKEAERANTHSKRMQVYEQVTNLASQGYNQDQIATQLGISRKRVRQYLQAPPIPVVYSRPGTKLDAYKRD